MIRLGGQWDYDLWLSRAKRKRRKFTAEHKAEVAGLVGTSGKGIGQATRTPRRAGTAARRGCAGPVGGV
jgi:hypothetical protein